MISKLLAREEVILVQVLLGCLRDSNGERDESVRNSAGPGRHASIRLWNAAPSGKLIQTLRRVRFVFCAPGRERASL